MTTDDQYQRFVRDLAGFYTYDEVMAKRGKREADLLASRAQRVLDMFIVGARNMLADNQPQE